MTQTCLNCKKKLKNLPGKRKKAFCNSTCRSGFWHRNNRKQLKANELSTIHVKEPQ